MTSWKRSLPFLLLNIVISAVTTLLVLTWWEQSHRTALPASQSSPTAAATLDASAGATQPATGDYHIVVENVFGAGDLANEVVVIRREGDSDLALTGWKLRDESGKEYTFPNLTLKNGAIRVYTRSGTDSVIELFWGQKEAIWQAGELVTLVDPQGTLQASYRIP